MTHTTSAGTIPTRRENWCWASWMIIGLAVTLFWIGFDIQLERLYAPYPYHRLQAEALLDGRLSLSSSVEQIDHGLVWHDGQVQQVWGVGIALWMVPFELVWRVFRASPCPDRIPLLVALALFTWYAARGGLAVAHALRSKISGLSFVYLVVFFPPLWNLILGRQAVFEETILYASLLSMGLLVGVVRFLLLRQRSDFWIVCALGALAGLTRVTHGVYGATAGLLCALVMMMPTAGTRREKRSEGTKRISAAFLGCALLLFGFGLLAWSNYLRFGSVTELGHRLTNHNTDVVYLTRFENPFSKVGPMDASKELFSWIFLSPFHQEGSGYEHLLPWQAALIRWRGVEQSTFDPSYLLILLGAFSVGLLFLHGRTRRFGWRLLYSDKPLQRVVTGLILWCGGSALTLAAFYLYSPIVTTRYILDLAPSLLAPAVVLLLLLARRWPRVVPAVCLVWTCCESVPLWRNQRVIGTRGGLSLKELSGLPNPNGKTLSDFEGRYTSPDQPGLTGIKYNGAGWNADGSAAPVVNVFVDHPQFLEIVVELRKRVGGPDHYGAKIGNMELPLEFTRAAEGTNPLVEMRFRVPEAIQNDKGIQLVFLSFASAWDEPERQSRRAIREIRWK